MRFILPAAAALALTVFAGIALWRGQNVRAVAETDRWQSADEAGAPRQERPASVKTSLKESEGG
jgi:hypothetical protein